MSANALDGAWVAVHVKLHRERSIAAFLSRLGYELFLPTYAEARASQTASPRPLFPGYLFCRYLSKAVFRIVQVPGVIRLVGNANSPEAVDEAELDAIRRIVDLGVMSEPWRFLELGQRVRIVEGPLRDIEGTLTAVRNGWRLIVSVTLLQRAVAVEVDARSVESVRPNIAGRLVTRAANLARPLTRRGGNHE
jgi:transcription antitermination factor NusG